jgi:hypothetical protein
MVTVTQPGHAGPDSSHLWFDQERRELYCARHVRPEILDSTVPVNCE